ncbi:MAG: hypothetical protein HQL90_13855 [Magnetococcales bacterium]|nr:hypothetical protein [Magnetococcales bacterium]
MSLLTVEGSAAEFYRCLGNEGPPLFFPQTACQLLSDPTTPSPTSSIPEPSPAPPAMPPDMPTTSAGPWQVTQLFVPAVNGNGHHWQPEAMINNRRVGVGAVVDGGRVQAITRTTVIMAHPGGKTVLPFGKQTTATTNRQPLSPVSPAELAAHLPHLLHRLAAGEELLIVENGIPLARLQPVPVAGQ